MKDEKIRRNVRRSYAKVARESGSCCGTSSTCCGGSPKSDEVSSMIGYRKEELEAVPEGANLGLGCGNPVAFASLRKGETVLDLGSGPGLDCFLAANKVGPSGRVIGVDMTPEMIDKARDNARKGKYGNVEFRLGEIENLPVADSIVDVVISNCVINLSTDKRRVFEEAFRVLKPGGRVMVSDIVLLKDLPEAIKSNAAAYVGCVSGAMLKSDYLRTIEEAGFQQVETIEETSYPLEFFVDDQTAKTVIKEAGISVEKAKEIVSSILSVKVRAVKPT